jgi:hypothetical protein
VVDVAVPPPERVAAGVAEDGGDPEAAHYPAIF